MKTGLVGGSVEQWSAPFDAQRTINMYPVTDDQGAEVTALYSCAGLSVFGVVGSGNIRGMYSSTNGRAFVVSGAGLYEVQGDGTSTLRGSLLQSDGIVTIAENGLQLAVCDGANLYILTYATNVFAQVTDADLPSCGAVDFLDGYFIVNKNGKGQFFISGLYDGTSWDALDFATAESSPDKLLRAFNGVGQLWLFGERTTEIWYNSGAAAFPFSRVSGGKIDVGILSPFTAVAVDNSVFWVGRDVTGKGIVYKTRGFSPQRVSNNAIEVILQRLSDTDNLRAYTYQEDGHVFYVITGGDLETTLVYDISTGVWHEKAFTNEFGDFEQHLGCCFMTAFGKLLVGDRQSGNVYQQSMDFYDDAGNALVRERTFTHIVDELKRVRYNTLAILMETGVGLQEGQGSDPQIALQLSKDGARTWSNWYNKTFGLVGQYRQEVTFRRLGVAQQMTFRVRISDPVKVSLIGAYLS